MLARAVSFSAAGNAPGVYAPKAAGVDPTTQPQVHIVGLTFVNTSTTSGATVVVRDGGSTGSIVAAGTVAAGTATVPTCFDGALHNPRATINGFYVEVDGGTVTGTVWVL